MPDRIKYKGFSATYNKSVTELITLVDILPIFTADKASRNIPVQVKVLWDTGATVTCIKYALWEKLKL